MTELVANTLKFSFPEVHPNATLTVDFQRTLRIPEDKREYSLPPGLGSFPLSNVDDHEDTVPENWMTGGGVFLPMYQAEAMWIYFHGFYPMAVKVAAGGINAITGQDLKDGISKKIQDYLVVPDQPWLDGFNVDDSLIRQFVAMPLGEGYTAEEKLTGEGEHVGVQIIVYPMKKKEYDKLTHEDIYMTDSEAIGMRAGEAPMEMGHAPGGLMRQKIYEDTYGFKVWDRKISSRCIIHIVNSLQYLALTGEEPPTIPLDAQSYTNAGLPWFEYYDNELTALAGAKKLAGLDSLAGKKGKGVLIENAPVEPKVVKKRVLVREGRF